MEHQRHHCVPEMYPAAMFVVIPGFVIALIALEAKLERTPFDIPQAETEIVGGVLTEYSGEKTCSDAPDG